MRESEPLGFLASYEENNRGKFQRTSKNISRLEANRHSATDTRGNYRSQSLKMKLMMMRNSRKSLKLLRRSGGLTCERPLEFNSAYERYHTRMGAGRRYESSHNHVTWRSSFTRQNTSARLESGSKPVSTGLGQNLESG